MERIIKVKNWLQERSEKFQFEFLPDEKYKVVRLKDGKVFGQQFNDGTFEPYEIKVDGIIQTILVLGWVKLFFTDKIHITLVQEASFRTQPQKEFSETQTVFVRKQKIQINDFEKEQKNFREELRMYLQDNLNLVNSKIRANKKG